jgi:hypothetical protein
MERKYKQVDLKITNLVNCRTENPNNNAQFYPRVVNNTDITFTDEEMTLLNKALKYSLQYKVLKIVNTYDWMTATAASRIGFVQ